LELLSAFSSLDAGKLRVHHGHLSMKVDDLAIKDGDFAWQIMKEEGISVYH
jgi:hypothetical protein